MRILIAPNSFKECADSVEISDLLNKHLSKNNSIKTVLKPLSDGGDGFLSVIKKLFDTVEYEIPITDEFDQTNYYLILIDKKNDTAYLESASVIGLKHIEEKNRRPMQLNTSVIGKIIHQLSVEVNQSKLKIKNLVIGIGGTATIDFGIGACSQLDLSLFDNNGILLSPDPQNFNDVYSIKFVKPDLPFTIKCIVDVDTALIGEPGAIEIYGKQKGASDEELKKIKSGIKNILNLISADERFEIPNNLNGAGGGLAAGLNIFLNAELIKAEEFIKNFILKDLKLEEIDSVITGEGSFDFQSFEGKGAGIILQLFEKKNIPIFLINGSTNLPPDINLSENVLVINLIDFFGKKKESIINYRTGIEKAAKIVLYHLNK
jgi:glycerate 2-kinase